MNPSDTVTAIRDRQDHLRAVFSRINLHRTRPRSLGRRIRSLYEAADLLDPSLVTESSAHPFLLLASAPWCRRLWEWDGQGGLPGLTRHLLVSVRYPLPEFLFTLPAHRTDLYQATHNTAVGSPALRLLAHLGSGGSMRDAQKRDLLPACLTRRMMHTMLTLKGRMSLGEAIRRSQIQAMGGPEPLAAALSQTRLGNILDDEPAWEPIIRWLCRTPPMRQGLLRTLVDFLYSLTYKERIRCTRRSVEEALERADQWHRARLYPSAATRRGPLPTSGLLDGEFDEVWCVRQIRSSEALFDEGRELMHCVASYWNAIMSRRSTIFSLTRQGARCITVEVRLSEAAVVQARGLQNRRPSPEELSVITRWADDNRLTVRSV